MTRILAVARLRLIEALRGPAPGFLVLFLVLAVAAAALVPGEPGPGRQRAVDGLVLDALLLVTALAAAALGAASLPGDREAGRSDLVAASPVRSLGLLGGGLLGHAAALALLVAGCFAGFLSITGFLTGGDRHRAPTRDPIRAEVLTDGTGRVVERPVVLTPEAPAATFLLPAGRAAIRESAGAGGSVRGWLELIELPDPQAGIPDSYELLVRIGETVAKRVTVHRGIPVEFTLSPEEVPEGAETPVTVRRLDPTMTIAVEPGGLLVEGPLGSFFGNVVRAAVAWILGLVVVAAAAGALSTAVGAPVAVAATLLFTLVGRSLPTLGEAAGYLERAGSAPARLADGVWALVGLWPDFDAFDRTRLVTARWSIPAGELAGRIPPALVATAVFLALGCLVLEIRRRW